MKILTNNIEYHYINPDTKINISEGQLYLKEYNVNDIEYVNSSNNITCNFCVITEPSSSGNIYYKTSITGSKNTIDSFTDDLIQVIEFSTISGVACVGLDFATSNCSVGKIFFGESFDVEFSDDDAAYELIKSDGYITTEGGNTYFYDKTINISINNLDITKIEILEELINLEKPVFIYDEYPNTVDYFLISNLSYTLNFDDIYSAKLQLNRMKF